MALDSNPDTTSSDATFPFYIAIAAHGDATRLRRTLESLAICRLPQHYRGLLLVENGARCGIEAMAAAAPPELKIRYLYHSPPSKSAALNLALAEVTESNAFIFFTDDDASFAPDFLDAYAQAAAVWGPGHYFGGPVRAQWEVPPPAWLLPSLPGSAKGWQPQQGATLYAFPGINWGAFIVDLRAIGPFDTCFGPGSPHGATGQETDMQARMYRAGLKAVYLKNASVTHEVPRIRCNFLWALRRNYRSGISAGLTEAPFRPPASLGGPAAASKFVKIRRLLAQVQGPVDLTCRLVCETTLRMGIYRGRWISRRKVK